MSCVFHHLDTRVCGGGEEGRDLETTVSWSVSHGGRRCICILHGEMRRGSADSGVEADSWQT